MFMDILFIVTTAFAMFGLYCFVEMVSDMFHCLKFPPTVTIIFDSEDIETYRKIKYIQQNIPNNYLFFYDTQTGERVENQQQLLEKYLKDVLSVNNK